MGPQCCRAAMPWGCNAMGPRCYGAAMQWGCNAVGRDAVGGDAVGGDAMGSRCRWTVGESDNRACEAPTETVGPFLQQISNAYMCTCAHARTQGRTHTRTFTHLLTFKIVDRA